MRALNSQAATAKAELIEKAAKEKKIAEQQAAESKALIVDDRTKLEASINNLQQRKVLLEQEVEKQKKEQEKLTQEEEDVSGELAQTDQMINELVGVIRINAKDIDTLISGNHQTALLNNSPDFLAKLSDENVFPGMDEIELLADALFEQIEKSAEVTRSLMPIIDRDGKTVNAEVLVLGPFCAAYRANGEVGFLNYSPSSGQLYALSKLPPKRMQKQLIKYFEAESESVPMDITRGASLQQLSHRLSLMDHLFQFGP